MSTRLVVGLTGGIGSGKSSVAEALGKLGADMVDADAVSHALTRKGAAGWTAIREQWGERFLRADGELDRAALRKAVFADPEIRRCLEAILHPLIIDAIAGAMAQWRAPYGILMVPLLLEGGPWRDQIDRLLVVDCPEDEQVRRVVARSGMAPDEVRAIMRTQVDRATRLAAADDVVDNGGLPAAIGPQVERLDALYRRLANGRAPPAPRRKAPP